MKTFAYLRVSGLSQVDGDGGRRQLDAITQFCVAYFLPPGVTHFEKAVSGTVEGMDRPVFFEMLRQCERGDVVIVERLDRLARDLMIQEFILKECRERGVQVFAVDQGQPVDLASNSVDPTRKLMRQIMGAVAEWEKSALVLKLRKARDEKRARGEYCGGNTPYGTQPGEWEILNAMRTLRESKDTDQEISRILNLAGHRTRTGKLWQGKNVRAILNGWNCRKHRKEVSA